MENLPELPNSFNKLFDRAIKGYANSPYFRALVQAIPHVGGSIDTILYEKGSLWKEERLEHFIKVFSQKIDNLNQLNEQTVRLADSKINSEDFHDLFMETIKSIITTKEKEKINLFANILLNYIESSDEGNEAGIYIQLLDSLSIDEIALLKKILNSKDRMTVYEIEGRQTFWEQLKSYLESNKKKLGSQKDIPETCTLSDLQVYLITRMRNMLITEIDEHSSSSTMSYTISNASQSSTYQIHGKQIDYSINRFGKKFINWIKLNSFKED
ncbi:hypothetical protein [Leptospira haakeii]|uniref:DUF4393 domain-containing protein n=1 Tax=Leptospira haakeii TaxID=2023198 RepID=A0ABX4PEX4_9LEPT|nr:hypothetical protein [Leptospira haakeii]PKA14316.1 hypothetical protein CH363_19130 [Leptospira haakeii]PKA18174.1 hypothetical protein CH377_18885 [Leptospira haakeii]